MNFQGFVEEEWSCWLWSHHLLHLLQQCHVLGCCYWTQLLPSEVLLSCFVSLKGAFTILIYLVLTKQSVIFMQQLHLLLGSLQRPHRFALYRHQVKEQQMKQNTSFSPLLREAWKLGNKECYLLFQSWSYKPSLFYDATKGRLRGWSKASWKKHDPSSSLVYCYKKYIIMTSVLKYEVKCYDKADVIWLQRLLADDCCRVVLASGLILFLSYIP